MKKPKTLSHAEQVKRDLLNEVEMALGNAPSEYDPKNPKVTIAVNGSEYRVFNTVQAIGELQARLLKLKTTVTAAGVPKEAIRNNDRMMQLMRNDQEHKAMMARMLAEAKALDPEGFAKLDEWQHRNELSLRRLINESKERLKKAGQ